MRAEIFVKEKGFWQLWEIVPTEEYSVALDVALAIANELGEPVKIEFGSVWEIINPEE